MRLKLVAVAVAALAPVVGMLAYSEIAMRQQRSEEVRAAAAQASRLASSEVERIIEGLHSLLIAVSAIPSVQQLDGQACGEALKSVAVNVSNIRTIFVLDLQGKTVCGTLEQGEDISLADRDYFKDALSQNGFVVGTYTRSRLSGGSVLPVAMPITHDGKTVGVVATGILLGWLQEKITERDVASGNAITIADRNGTILARVPYPEKFVGTVIPDTFQRLIHSDNPGTLEIQSQDGTERVLGYRPIKLPREPLYVSAGFSKTEAFASINRSTLINSLSILGGVLLAFLASILIGNRFILSPVARIADVMERWRNGETDARTGMGDHGDELATVGATLDRLLDELDCRRRRNEQAEEERSLLARELAHRVKNSFSLVQAIARQTFRRSDPQVYAIFSDRLEMLAGAFDLLLNREMQAAPMAETITKALQAHGGRDADRFDLDGPDITLPADLALSLSLVIHELSTNAAKYGALSVRMGGSLSAGRSPMIG
ncbi:sensor histidine kinase [Neorhizobium lilium]|uniref:sensor histidine kinase n=1 Tax=Neorhizobium lilium TaxID=2503024 RepID=UPI00315DE37D